MAEGDAFPQGGSIEAAFVLTISDGVTNGTRQDASGDALEGRLRELGYGVARAAVPDDADRITEAVRKAVDGHRLVISTGGTGLGPRDATPQALRVILDYEIPGFGEVMRSRGRESTVFADLSRSLAGVAGRALVIAVPGSPRAALESLAAVEELLAHALETLGGRTQSHPVATDAGHVHGDSPRR